MDPSAFDPILDTDPDSLEAATGVRAGMWVRAKTADWLNDMVDDPERPVDPAPADPWVEGVLVAVRVDSLAYWGWSVAGRSVDPTTAVRVP